MTAPSLDEQFEQVVRNLGLAEPKHSHDPKSPITHVLNVSRRNGTPYQPRHCACPACRHGFTHIAAVSR